MRPPICAICHSRMDEQHKDFELLSFQLSEADKEFNKRLEQPGFVGHPHGLEWFCKEHAAIAKKYNHLTLGEAIKKIQKEIG